jgi:hypothetical protein
VDALSSVPPAQFQIPSNDDQLYIATVGIINYLIKSIVECARALMDILDTASNGMGNWESN